MCLALLHVALAKTTIRKDVYNKMKYSMAGSVAVTIQVVSVIECGLR